MEEMIQIGPLQVSDERLAELCRQYRVQELSVFGSMARGDNRPDSDVDLLVTFQPEAKVGLLAFAALMRELSELMGRKVDLVSKRGLKPLIRSTILDEARLLYAG
jgi:predicted nucleotidyltransferase